VGLYLRHPASFEHDTGAHPESPRRIVAIERALSERDWLGLDVVEAPAAELAHLARVHSREHVERIRAISEGGGGMIDMDTVMSPGSYEAAVRAAGGAVHAVDRQVITARPVGRWASAC